MSPRVFKDGEFIFWFHSFDALNEQRASVHVGKGTQNDGIDAKIWLEPRVEVARAGRALSKSELSQVLRITETNRERLLEAWYAHRGRGR